MKRKQPLNPPASGAVETFGGDYHRLESDFRLKTAPPSSTKAAPADQSAPRKGGGKKRADGQSS
jgi:hypothetical protein